MAKFEAKQKNSKPSTPKETKKSVQYTTSEYVNKTPVGEKKILDEFQASYDPIAVEAAWMDWWQKKGFFKPEVHPEGTPYVICYPPPNVTGSLHIGHALGTSVQDALIRYHRMRGYAALYVPGCDHAGIATQSVVEKQLMKTGKTRHDLGKEAFLGKVWEWKDQYGHRIYDQMKQLGGSFDWDRATFTMDPHMVHAVNTAFVRGFNKGLIYRDTKLVNWCSHLNTALSNLEVDQKELTGKTMLPVPGHKGKYLFGAMVHFKYECCNKDGDLLNESLIIATTRIETMLGDAAVLVHPEDARYKHLHGAFIKHPFNKTVLPIIADDYVDMEFGTGAVKITPAHDFNDYAIAKKHDLPMVNILNDDGTMNEVAGDYANMKRFDCRTKILDDLETMGLLVEIKDHTMQIPVCSRSGDVIEPRLKPQWWMNCTQLAKKAMEIVPKELLICPEQSEKEWFRWLENIQDWCLSRQLWWGHQIPAFLIVVNGTPLDPSDMNNWVVAMSKEEALEQAQLKHPNCTVQQDEDVLDTWFSSGLWPFATLGWPNETKYFPTTLLETGKDILFFWVARMVMMSLLLTDQVPFQRVFCHAMVRDAMGRKMSKSLGNVVDPVDVIRGISLEALHEKLTLGNLAEKEVKLAKKGQKQAYPKGIPQCGTDALRFALCAYTSHGNSINLDILRVEGYRKFCNKMWNAVKFAMGNTNGQGDMCLAEKWIWTKLQVCCEEVHVAMDQYNFMQATSSVYRFFLNELCDVFIECSKHLQCQDTLTKVIDQALRLMHPFMPFVTEELWQRLPVEGPESICIAKYPEYNKERVYDVAVFDHMLDVMGAIRSMLAKYQIRGQVYLETPIAQEEVVLMGKMIKGLDSIQIQAPPSGCIVTMVGDTKIYLLIKGLLDIAKEVEKIQMKIGKLEKSQESLRKVMNMPDYESKVKEDVREQNSAKWKGLDTEIMALKEAMDELKAIE